jgi:hypothetical protein
MPFKIKKRHDPKRDMALLRYVLRDPSVYPLAPEDYYKPLNVGLFDA